MIRYQHVQIGYVLLVALGAGLVAISSIMWVSGFNWVGLLVMIILLVCLGLFAILTVRVDDETLTVQFGPGVFPIVLQLRNVKTYRIVKNPWYYGWGIRYIFGGWLFNVSGFTALELQMNGGTRYRIGTDDPAGLLKAVEEILANSPSRRS